MDYIKEAFQKVKEDMNYFNSEINYIKEEITDLKKEMVKICEILKILSENPKEVFSLSSSKDLSTDEQTTSNIPTDRQVILDIPTHPSTHQTHINPLNDQNKGISTGNGGVPTDKQTDRQTDQQTHFSLKSSYNKEENSIENALEFIESLDNLKKELRLKFKRLTEQEMIIFSTLYQLSDQQGYSDYKEISKKLNLSESSIRDYVGRLIKKGIPIEKTKVNNKSIQLSISSNLKKIATLSTLLQLREL